MLNTDHDFVNLVLKHPAGEADPAPLSKEAFPNIENQKPYRQESLPVHFAVRAVDGADDFVIVVSGRVGTDYFQPIVEEFENEVLRFYNQEDIEKGYIIARNRRNEVEKFPLITLTAVSVNDRDRHFKDMFELTETLAALKKSKKLRISGKAEHAQLLYSE